MSQLTAACNKNYVCITTPVVVVVVVSSGVVVNVVVVSILNSKQATSINRRGEHNKMMHCHS